MRAQNVRDFPQTKLDSEINAPFLLNEHGDPRSLFHNFNENNILSNSEDYQQKSMATFLANERKVNKHYRKRYYGPNNACPICVSFKG